MAEKIFDISFEFNDREYKGWANPSDELNDSGVPVSFHVVLDGTSFGYVSFRDCKWFVNQERPEGLVRNVGKQIEKHYQL